MKPKQTKPPEPTAIIPRPRADITSGSLELYLAEINRFPMLTRDEEFALALKYWKSGDVEAAQRLVTANLRFVVKIALQYAKYGVKLKDLIQEGNIGLMMAVKKYNPNLGFRLISYAVWWIRAYVQKYLLDNWSVVKVGTTQAQRKLFNAMKRTQRELEAMDGVAPTDQVIAKALEVSEKDVREMRQRLKGHDLSLDTPIDADGSTTTRLDLLPSAQIGMDEELIRRSEQHLVWRALEVLKSDLNAKEMEILEQRLLTDEPVTLQEIGDKMGISRERVRQIEENVKKKLKTTIEELTAVNPKNR